MIVIYWKYFKYIVEHKRNVFKECLKMSKDVKGKNKRDLIVHAFAHDLSKFNPKEFIPYAKHFYGSYPSKTVYRTVSFINRNKMTTKEDVKELFEEAWKHHYFTNKHHWNYWCYDEYKCELDTPRVMPIKYMLQMICDWNAMSVKFGGTTKDFYLKNYDKIQLNAYSRVALNLLLSVDK